MTGTDMSKTLVFVRTSCVEHNLPGVKAMPRSCGCRTARINGFVRPALGGVNSRAVPAPHTERAPMPRPKVILNLYPVFPADGFADRVARRPLGATSL